eukprot:6470198-Amphidinium_carterae.1
MMWWDWFPQQEQVPTKRSKKLQKDANDFEKAAKSKDYDATLSAFNQYLDDLPSSGPGLCRSCSNILFGPTRYPSDVQFQQNDQ